MFKQISEKEDTLENVNFSDVFSHLREEVMRSPEKLNTNQDTMANHQSKDLSDVSSITKNVTFNVFILGTLTILVKSWQLIIFHHNIYIPTSLDV